ncbi:MAG: DUF1800 domain-containing protein [Aureispira sp.]|nr:DUF1800 domain-containing protein [Aureispira sp.]
MEDILMEILFLNRVTYGYTSEAFQEFREKGPEAYIEEQLNPKEDDDPILKQKLKELRVPIKYEAKGRKVNEKRPLDLLDVSMEKLWEIAKKEKSLPHQEKMWPAMQVAAATWMRAIHSKWQLKEILVEFWHNHFNVSIDADERIAIAFPFYDREVIRKHCLGNFREFLEAVATSPAMLYYLDNAVSKASPANENYARELFELHTLGADNYLNHLYNRWKEVPGATEGKPEGYIDEDVYEAARAFTGWTVADGSKDYMKNSELPNTGAFHYYDGWHDNYQKRVLGTEFAPNQGPMADGRKVLDLVAYHPGTAQFICKKLCRRLVADNPPQSLIDKAAKVWIAEQKSPDQIKKVVKAILTDNEIGAYLGKKLKRPFELVTSCIRATQTILTPNQKLQWMMNAMGYQQFTWPTPTGHPDTADYWLNSNMVLGRWNIIPNLLQENWHKLTEVDLKAQMPKEVKTCQEIVEFWVKRIYGRPLEDKTILRLTNFMAAGGVEDEEPFGEERELEERLYSLVALIMMVPEFQYR